MPDKHIAIGEALKFGWRSFQGNVVWWLGFFAALIGIYLFFGLLSRATADQPASTLLVNIAAIIVQMLTSLAFITAALKFSDGQRPRAAELAAAYPMLFKFVAASIIYELLVFAGLLLFVIPGVVWAIKFQFFGYCIVDQKLGPLAALKASARLTAGIKWELLGFFFVAMLLNIAGAIIFFIGLLATIPTTIIATACLYRALMLQIARVPAAPPASIAPAAPSYSSLTTPAAS